MASQQKKELSNTARYLTFFLRDELYGIGIENVQEIIAMMKITVVPKTPSHIKGVMNLRGNIIPIVDMRTKFDMEAKEPDMYTAIVIVAIAGTSIGFIVDTVEEVMQISEDALMEAPNFGTQIDTSFISQMAQRDEDVIMLLDLDKVFGGNELSSLESLAKNNEQ